MNYSVIIPHKNVPDLLDRCLKSIPQRSDLEIIIVDDNSDPTIVDFNKFPGLDSNNVRCYFTKDGRGAGYARNVALKESRGKWLIFADADDYFTDFFPSILDKYADDDKTDLVFFNAVGIDENGKRSFVNVQRYIDNYNNRKRHSELVLRYGCWAPWTRMIKRNIPIDHDVWFEEVPVGNDMMFVIQSTLYAKTIMVENDFVYYYFKPTWGSLTSKQRTVDNAIMRLESRFSLNSFYKSINYPYIWPIWRDYYKIKDRKSVKAVLEKHDYSITRDFINTIIYFFAKLRKTL